MDRLISQGKITYVGSSNFPGWAIARFNERAAASHRLGLVCEQSLYNLVERRAELEVIPACQAYGVGVIAWSPLAGGLLAGAPTEPNGRRAGEQASEGARAHAQRLADFAVLCAGLGQSPGVVAIAWLLHQPGVTAAIVGPRRRDQFASLLKASELVLEEAVLSRLDAIFPPCGPAPEAYAW
jgi:aryl-alcohol dehydrogenase-like predicted oxidoreductase